MSFSDGSQQSWDQMQGKWIIVNFFAEWCKPCLKEIPELNKFNKKAYKMNAQLIGISYDPLTDEQILDLVKRYDIDFPILLGKEKVELPTPWPRALPTTYIFSPDGKLVKKMMGEQTYYSLKKTIIYLNKEYKTGP